MPRLGEGELIGGLQSSAGRRYLGGMAIWSDNIEAVVRALTAKRLGHNGISAEKLAPDVDMRWHMNAAEFERGVIDETGEYVGGQIDWARRMAGHRDWTNRHPESRAVWETAQYGAPLPRN
ncbi:MAG: hypothetical protein OXI81_16990 [Paracoccaceae bacterium]|nr:hypothetical protein [Paracoccaceae bacterium]